MTDEQNTTATATASPITAGAPASKKANKKTAPAKKAAAPAKAAKPAPAAKKTPAPAASANGVGRSAFANDMTIKVLKTDHGLKGKRGEAMDCLKDGTVEKVKAALAKKDLAGYAGFVFKTAVANKLATIK